MIDLLFGKNWWARMIPKRLGGLEQSKPSAQALLGVVVGQDDAHAFVEMRNVFEGNVHSGVGACVDGL